MTEITPRRKILGHSLIGVKGRFWMATLECEHHETANDRELKRGWLYCFSCLHNLKHAKAWHLSDDRLDHAMRTGDMRP